MTMVEQVARAQWEERRKSARVEGFELEEWGDGFIPCANGIMEEARAAIAAMREPTEDMHLAMSEHNDGQTFSDTDAIWRAAIDAALKEEPK